ncbi:uncharacterized protein DUF732 [Motilibacter peucedani]|uniref:Uncharacterized protein DUF732 n=1 Tax=Motilibacter peucedani TaxID=598650 RepID=A0A420XLM9_9ACTN|nr:DUF732 domain-containing protein [Motilibacter peucedani]RKS71434.1 uncharacterized protein DUF732 [Motilibacter peucedani]
MSRAAAYACGAVLGAVLAGCGGSDPAAPAAPAPSSPPASVPASPAPPPSSSAPRAAPSSTPPAAHSATPSRTQPPRAASPTARPSTAPSAPTALSGTAAFVAVVRAKAPEVAAGRLDREIAAVATDACDLLASGSSGDEVVARTQTLGTLDAEATDQATARELVKLAIDTVCLDQARRVDEF